MALMKSSELRAAYICDCVRTPIGRYGGVFSGLRPDGLAAISIAAPAIKAGEAEVIIAGGVESMSRVPFVMGKAAKACKRTPELYDATLGRRFVNPKLKAMCGVEAMAEGDRKEAIDNFEIAVAKQDAQPFRGYSSRSRRYTISASAGRPALKNALPRVCRVG